MPPQKTKVEMAGVAAGKELIGTPTDDHVSAEDRVKSLFANTLSQEVYQVSTLRFAVLISCSSDSNLIICYYIMLKGSCS
jgi:hypothetical protein